MAQNHNISTEFHALSQVQERKFFTGRIDFHHGDIRYGITGTKRLNRVNASVQSHYSESLVAFFLNHMVVGDDMALRGGDPPSGKSSMVPLGAFDTFIDTAHQDNRRQAIPIELIDGRNNRSAGLWK